jgi:eukaryotic-like serine/threonine-protein kinase
MAVTPKRVIAGRYALERPLGRGGMGVVWHAHDRLLGRAVAVKEISLPDTVPEQERQRLQARVLREARAAARLNHPVVITLHDVVTEQGQAFLVMALVTAPTLAKLVREQGPLPPERAARIGLQVASVLEAAHEAGVVHRDVKPANVMVAEDGRVWLADFGIAQLQGDPQLTTSGLIIGSPAYMAPEQAHGSSTGPETDLWGLGATMYYAVEGSSPFERGNSIATLAAVVNEPPRPPLLAGALGPIIMSLLVKDPATRPALRQVHLRLARIAGANWEPAAGAPAPAPAAPHPAAPQPAAPQPAEPPAQLEAPPQQQPEQEPVVAAAEAAGAAASPKSRSRSRSRVRRRLVALAMLAGVAAVLLVLVAALGSHQRSGGTRGGHGPPVTGHGPKVASTGAGSTPATTAARGTTSPPTTTTLPSTTAPPTTTNPPSTPTLPTPTLPTPTLRAP